MAEKKERGGPVAEQENKAGNAAAGSEESENNEKTATKTGKKGKLSSADVAALETRLADAETREGELKDQYMRTLAEYDNFRKRNQAEKDAAFNGGVAHAAEELLPVLDVLYAAADTETSDEEYKKGVLLTLAKCEEVFKKLGIEEIDAAGKPFDPEVHNACMQEECEGVESGTVSRVMQRGYILNGRVIRHAVVAVST